MRTEEFPFAEYADSKTPLLQFAARGQRAAHNTAIEWLVDEPEVNTVLANYMQIVRTPFVGGDREKWRALERHLEAVEKILWFGQPLRSAQYSTCGGALHYLKREPLRADMIRLRPLRDLVLLRDRREGDEFRSPEERTHEFLSEFSLEVTAAPAIRRPRS